MSNTVYDPDSDDKIIPGSHDDLGVHPEHREAEIDDLERQVAGPSANDPHADTSAGTNATDPPSSGELKQSEEQPPDRSGFSAADMINEKLGKGYTGKGSQQSKFLSKLVSSDSKFKRRVAVAGAAAGGSVVAGVFLFLAMLPLKIDTMVSRLELKYSAASASALDTEMENSWSSYVTKYVIPGIHAGRCKTTAEATCVASVQGTTPISQMFVAWKDARLEQKLATKYGIVIGAKGNSYYMNVGAHSYALHEGQSIFDLPGTNEVSRNDIRHAVRDALKEGTLYDRVYTRYKLGLLLERKYGIKRCLIACDARDKFTDKIADKKLAGKSWLIDRVVTPFSASKGLIMTCVLAGNCNTDPSTHTDDPNDPERVSGFQRDLQAKLDSFAATYGSEKLANIVEKANAISKDGLTKYITKQIAQSVVEKVGGGDAAKAVAGETVDRFIPIAGWIVFGSAVINFLHNAGPQLQAANYAVDSSAAVGMYMTFKTAASELRAGHVDPTEFGSLTETLSNGGIDASSTPAYNTIMNDGSSSVAQTALSNLLPHGYADSTSSKYLCANGKPVPAGETVCDEEKFNGGSTLASAISNGFNNLPGSGALSELAGLIHSAAAQVNSFIGGVISLVPGVSEATSAIAKLAQPLFGMLTQYLLPNIFADGLTNGYTKPQVQTTSLLNNVDPQAYADTTAAQTLPSGGRVFDLMAGGADVAQNKSCQVTLGCAKISNTQVAQLQNEQLADAKQSFAKQSMFARMFSTNSPFSLTSHLAVAMPANLQSVGSSGFANIINSPFGSITGAFSSIFSSRSASALQAQEDPFGVPQSGYADEQIPEDPDAYWTQNCADPSDPSKLDQNKLNAWLDSQSKDPTTGESVATQPFQCLLIQSTAQTGGGSSDPKLLPSLNGGSDTSGDTTTTTTGNPTGSAQSLASQVLTLVQQKKITFEEASDQQNMVDTSQGKAISCTDEHGTVTLKDGISPYLSTFMIQMASKYSYRVSAMYSGHGGLNGDGCSDGGRHPMGRAIDVDQINGQAVDYGANQSLVREFAQYALTVLPKGTFLNPKTPLNMGGIGQEECFSPALSYPAGINHFDDTCTHLHLDVGSAGTNLQ